MFRGLIFIFALFMMGCGSTSRKEVRCPSSLTGPGCGPLIVPEMVVPGGADDTPLPSTGGFEFEGSLPVEVEFSHLADEVKSFLQKIYPEDQITVSVENSSWYDNTYKVLHVRDGVEQIYTVKPDTKLYVDLTYEPEIKGVEITSPVFRTKAQASLFFQMLEHFRTFGLKSRSDIAGNHIHYGMRKDATYEDVLRLFKALERLLNVFTEDFAYNQERDEWIDLFGFKSLVSQLEEFVRDNPNTPVNSEKKFPPAFKRQSIVRIEPLLGTIELRIFNSNLAYMVNMFGFEFTMALFSRVLDKETDLSRYLEKVEEPKINEVLFLMGLDSNQAEAAFDWSRRRVQELSDSVKQRRLRKSEDRYVLPTPVEALVDDFWKQGFDASTVIDRLSQLAADVPPGDIGIALFNIISGKDFEELDENLRTSVLIEAERLGGGFSFLQLEIGAIRMLESPGSGAVLADKISKMEMEDNSVLHPIIRRLLLHLDRSPEDTSPFFEALAGDQLAFGRFFESYEKYIRIRSPQLTPSQVSVLGNFLSFSELSEIGFRVIQLVDKMKFEIRKQVRVMAPFFTIILEKAREEHKIALETLSVLSSIARNGSLAPSNYVSDPEAWLDLGFRHLERGHHPKLLVALLEFMNRPNSPLLNLKFKRETYDYQMEAVLKKYQPKLLKNEKANLRSAFSRLLYHDTDAVKQRFLRYLD